jgi:hypothetical protein
VVRGVRGKFNQVLRSGAGFLRAASDVIEVYRTNGTRSLSPPSPLVLQPPLSLLDRLAIACSVFDSNLACFRDVYAQITPSIICKDNTTLAALPKKPSRRTNSESCTSGNIHANS